jgi:ABC-type sugar transport system permease subunit
MVKMEQVKKPSWQLVSGKETGSRRPSFLKRRDYSSGYLFVLPALATLIVFRFYPIFFSIFKSFYQVSFAGGAREVFVGLQNYTALIHDNVFLNSLKVTLVLNVFINPIQIALSLVLAVLLNSNTLSIRIFRTLIMIPLGISLAIASLIWGFALNPHAGLVNSILGLLGMPPQPFLTGSTQALWSIMLIATWKGIAYWMIIFLAGLQEIPGHLYEAALIDGASSWQSFWKITLPLLKRVLLFVMVADTTANFLLFVPIFALTRGGPQMSTNVLMHEAYSRAFVYSDMNSALAIVTIILAILLVVVSLQFKLMRTGE